MADLLHKLADFRLTTREACYNTVRNITACPLSGLLADEVFDVHPYAQKVAFAFLHKDLTDSMPRKFKISFSGCKEDCMIGAIHDIGLRAMIRDGRRGFRMLVGGGLGPLPVEAHLLDEFVPVENLVSRCEAVIRLFNTHGNRKNKNKARLKFVVRERGWDWVKEEIERNYQDILEPTAALPRRKRSRTVSVVFNHHHHRLAPALSCLRSLDRMATGARITNAGLKPTFASRSKPATPWSRSRWNKAT